MKIDAAWLQNAELQTLAKAFKSANRELRFVGGCVRDTLLGKPFSDVDAATPATPDEVTRLLERAGIQAIPTGIDYGTVTALINHKPIQITTLRKDIATDGRHAEVVYTDVWEEDAARRDFTMNALYLDMNGTLYDYHRGAEDAKAGHVRFIGDATQRIREDYLRILRFFRFSAHYAKGPLDKAALVACASEAAGLEKLSGERIQTEMMKLFSAKNTADILLAMVEENILDHIALDHITIAAVRKLESCAFEIKNIALLKLACLLPDGAAITPLAERWRLSNDMQRDLKNWHRHAPLITPSMMLAEQKKAIRAWGVSDYFAAVLLSAARSSEPWNSYVPLMEVMGWKAPVFPVNGEDLKSLGIKPGKELGDVLKRLEEVWEQSDYQLSKQEILRLV